MINYDLSIYKKNILTLNDRNTYCSLSAQYQHSSLMSDAPLCAAYLSVNIRY